MLKAWKTPFEKESFPSIWAACEGELDKTLVFVGWPAEWQVKFEHVVGLKVCDETYDNNPRFWVNGDVDELALRSGVRERRPPRAPQLGLHRGRRDLGHEAPHLRRRRPLVHDGRCLAVDHQRRRFARADEQARRVARE